MRRNELYRGKPRGYYDPSPEEMFFVELGQEIFKAAVKKYGQKDLLKGVSKKLLKKDYFPSYLKDVQSFEFKDFKSCFRLSVLSFSFEL